MIALIITYIWFNFWAIMSGVKEAMIYGLKGAGSFRWDLHRFYMAERVVVFFGIFLGAHLNFYDILVLIAANYFSFFFWHDGFYEVARGRIDQYGKNFKSTSSTSTAKLNPNWDERRVMKVLSLVILITYIFYKY